MAGTINLSLSQQFDTQGDPLGGGLLYFYQSTTTNPQDSFQDFGLTIEHPNPIVLDASGRVPSFYLADGFIKIRLTDKNGVVLIAADQLLVIGPSTGGGGGGGGGGDATAVLQTGDIKARFGTGEKTGFVRCNGRTIGQTGSSATELADPLAQPLYEYLWGFDTILLDSGATKVNAVADFGALKRLILPDLRGRTLAGMDDMGATAAGRLSATYFGASALVLGNAGGSEQHTLTAAGQLPSHTHSTTVYGGTGDNPLDHQHAMYLTDPTHSHTILTTDTAVQSGPAGVTLVSAGPGTDPTSAVLTGVYIGSFPGVSDSLTTAAGAHSHTFGNLTVPYVSTSVGSSQAFATATPAMVLTFYIKL